MSEDQSSEDEHTIPYSELPTAQDSIIRKVITRQTIIVPPEYSWMVEAKYKYPYARQHQKIDK